MACQAFTAKKPSMRYCLFALYYEIIISLLSFVCKSVKKPL